MKLKRQAGGGALALRWAVVVGLLLAAAPGQAQGARELLNQSGRLTTRSGKLNSGEFAQPYDLPIRQGQVYCVRLYSTEFKPYVFVELNDGLQLDCSGVAGSAHLIFVAPRTATIRVLVTTVEVGEVGAFRLTVNSGELLGRLGDGDESLETGELVDFIKLYLTAGARLQLNLESGDFNPYLITKIGEDKTDAQGTAGQGTGATQQVSAAEAGEYLLAVTTVAPGENGAYSLKVSTGGAPGGGQPPPGGGQPQPGGGQPQPGGIGSILGGAAAGGQSLLDQRGRLEEGDVKLDSGEFRDEHFFNVQANQTVTVRCDSDEFDTYLIVQVPGVDEQIDEDDTGRGNTNARAVFTAPQAGRVRVLVTSARPGETGAYRLTVTVGGGGARGGQGGLLEGTSGARPGTGGAAQLQVGRAAGGRLQQGDSQLESGEFVDVFELPGQAGQTLVVTLTSTEFDPYLIAVLPGGQKLENDDDEDVPNSGSRLTLEFPQNGNATVAVTSYEAGETGGYQLQVEAGAAAGPSLGGGGGGPAIGADSFFEGDLDKGDRALESGEFYDIHELACQAGQTYVISLVSTDFDPYLIVVPPEGDQLDNDDDAGSLNSLIELRAQHTGAHRLVVTSATAGEMGHYTLSVRSGAAGGQRQVADGPTVGGPAVGLQPGADVQNLTGELVAGDAQLTSGEYTDSYTVPLRAGQVLEVQMTSDAVDPYVIVKAPDGTQEDNDDLQDGQTTAGLRYTATQNGDHRIICTTYAANETGSYQVLYRVSGGDGGAVTPPPGGQTPPPGGNRPPGSLIGGNFPSPFPTGPGGTRPGPGTGPAAAGGRKTWAVLVGIDAYPDSPLQFCAKDAQNIAAMLVDKRICTANEIRVITDREATRANIIGALQDFGRRAGPQDMLMFFFSGHGGQTDERPNSTEADQRDEFLFAIDGPILDDQLAQVLDGTRAGLALVYLDSCFSGGFAKDIIVKPGRMGVFSSDEDLTSNVAAKFQAGGYLSHFMLKGISGEADKDGDHVITASELSYYLEDTFTREAGNLGAVTSGEETGYQRVRIDRGGVKLSQPLFYLPR